MRERPGDAARPRVETIVLRNGLQAWLHQPHEGISLAWLGQAGFLLRTGPAVVLIDPYLSDHLARKYHGRPFPHARMMPAPIEPDQLPRVDLVLCTHRHGDHMDPGTLPVIARRHPGCRFVVPAAEREHATRLPLPPERLLAADAAAPLHPFGEGGLRIDPLPAAHETLQQDEHGSHRFLGYVLTVGGLRLYHSGDCVPFAGLPGLVRAARPDIALLPVNGRDQERAAAGVPGNFTLAEALTLCTDGAIPLLVPHHWGMFAFNTADPDTIHETAARQAARRAALGQAPVLLVPDARVAWHLVQTNGRGG
ncbi:MBL fold metallo-hydrolase [Rhizosaccharibacter radicis]|uniref:MBL fold metallo-hydrolase n=1 Tax=Rhizosaccharibacter radicis TaxID=2782605 RepID=A0ABT1W0X0_9PROT|nr:MBL fold metallo-hydrolase [Acetobacteraceae bacterium KSS12]